jgi:hypothetical protein
MAFLSNEWNAIGEAPGTVFARSNSQNRNYHDYDNHSWYEVNVRSTWMQPVPGKKPCKKWRERFPPLPPALQVDTQFFPDRFVVANLRPFQVRIGLDQKIGKRQYPEDDDHRIGDYPDLLSGGQLLV